MASGDPDTTSVILWTRLAPDPTNGGGMPDTDATAGHHRRAVLSIHDRHLGQPGRAHVDRAQRCNPERPLRVGELSEL